MEGRKGRWKMEGWKEGRKIGRMEGRGKGCMERGEMKKNVKWRKDDSRKGRKREGQVE